MVHCSTRESSLAFAQLRCVFEHTSTDPWVIYLSDMCDSHPGALSMTNDAERVCKWAAIEWPTHRVMYRDTDDRWDEMVHTKGVFNGFKPGKAPGS